MIERRPPTRRPAQLLAARSVALCLVTSALVLSGCGGGGGASGPKPQMPGAHGEEQAPAAAGTDPTAEGYITLGENPKWTPLRAMYDKYAAQKIDDLANPMLTNLVHFVDRPLIPEKRGVQLEDGAALVKALKEGKLTENRDPLTASKLNEYKLLILMTGTSRPKAVLLSPDGLRHTVARGAALGSEGGRIKAILQYKMLVSVPGERKLRTISIEPPLADLARKAEAARDF